MTTPKDGGPAFPSCGADGCGPSGISVRDYFAAKAMQAIFHVALQTNTNSTADKVVAGLAETAYVMADAMLAERSK